MAPSNRPRSLEELAELSLPTSYDPERSFKDQLRAIDTLRDQSLNFEKRGELEGAFITLARAAALITEKLPFHFQYDILSAKQKTDLAANGQVMLRSMDRLRPVLVERYNAYLAAGMPPSTKKRRGDDGKKQEPTQILPRTPMSMELSSSRSPTSGPTPGVTVMLSEAQERDRDRERGRRGQSAQRASTPHADNRMPTPGPSPDRHQPTSSELQERAKTLAARGRHAHNAELLATMDRLQEKYETELQARMNDPSKPDSVRMQDALEVVRRTGIAERQWITEKDQLREPGAPSHLQRELADQGKLEQERHAMVNATFVTRLEAKDRALGLAEQEFETKNRQEAAAREVQLRIARETQLRAERDLKARADEQARQRAADEARDKLVRDAQERAMRDERARADAQQLANAEVQNRVARETQGRAMREAALLARQREEQEREHEAREQALREQAVRDYLPEPAVLDAFRPKPHQPAPLSLSGPSHSSISSMESRKPSPYPILPSSDRSVSRSRPSAITYIPQTRDDSEWAIPPLPLSSPLRTRDDSHNLVRRSSISHQYPSPITTTSPPPRELQPYNQTITYPTLMSNHQRTQGYLPSRESMFFPRTSVSHEATPHALLFQPNGVTDFPTKTEDQWPIARAPLRPTHLTGTLGYDNPSPEYHGSAGPPPSLHGLPFSEPRAKSPSPFKAGGLRTVQLPMSTLPRFLAIAALNTEQKLETCGLLLGDKIDNRIIVTTLLIPRQIATESTCSMTDEEMVVELQVRRDLMTIGWIHTHPTQSCFMSSLDLHTHSGYQSMLPEAIAIVCAPKQTPNFGIFRLTDPPGLQLIKACTDKAAFHPHSDSEPIYTDADSGHVHLSEIHDTLEIIDLR